MHERTRTYGNETPPHGDRQRRAPDDATAAFDGAALAMLARVLGTIATAAAVLLTAGSLTGHDFGSYALATGIIGVIVVAADLGMTQALMRAHTAGRSTRGLLVRAGAMRIGLTGGAGCLVAAGVALIAHSDLVALVLAATVLGVAQSISGMATGLLSAQRRPRLLALTTIAKPVIELAGFGAVVLVSPTALGFVGVSIVAAGAVAIVSGAATLRGTPEASERPASLRSVARYGRYLAVVTLIWSASLQLDQVVIAAFHGAAAVAAYAFVWRVLMVLAIGAISAAAVVAPWATDPGVSGRVRAATFAAWHRGLVVVSAVLAGCMAVAGPLVVALVNPEFRGQALLAAALAPALVLLGSASFTSACLGYLGARGRLRAAVELLVLNAALDLLLVPWLGAWGASIASTIALARWAHAHVRLVGERLTELDPDVSVDAAGWPLIIAACSGAGVVAAVGVGAWALVDVAAGAPALVTAVVVSVASMGGALAWLAPTMRSLRSARHRDEWLVLHVAEFRAPYPGTFIRQFQVLAEKVATQGGRVALAIPYAAAEHPWARELAAGNLLDLHVLPASADSGPRARIAALRALIRSVRPDVVHTHFHAFDAPSAVACTLLAIREGWRPRLAWYYRTTIEGDAVRQPFPRRIKDLVLFRLVGAPVDVVTTISDGMAEQVARRGGRRIEVVRGGCDTTYFSPPKGDEWQGRRQRLRRQLGVGDEDVLLLHMGWHWSLKGGDVLDEVLAARAGLVDPVRGRSGGALVARSIGMPESVSATWVEPLPQTPDVLDLIVAADLFMAVSRWEAFGNSLVEAMSCGLVAVASDAPGHELTARGAPGVWMASAGSVDSTAAALAQALDARDEWATLGARNREHVVDRFDIGRWASELSTVHRRLAGAAVKASLPRQDASAHGDGTSGDGRDPSGAVAHLQVERKAAG